MKEPTRQFWKKAYLQNIDKLIGVCLRYTGDRQLSEDLAHDAFLKAIEKYTSFEGKGHFDAWLRRVVVNHVLQHLRDNKRKRQVNELMPYHEELHTKEEASSLFTNITFSATELLHIVDQLPAHHSWVFNLYVMEKYTHAQIAKELGISEGTSKSHLARARKKLKKLLSQKAKENEQQKDYKEFLLLLLAQDGDQHLSQLFEDGFDQFLVAPQNPLIFDTIPFSMPINGGTSILKSSWKILSISAVVVAVTVGILLVQPLKNTKPEATETRQISDNNAVEDNQELKNIQDQTATISKDSIIANRNKIQESMKSLDSLALMIAILSTTLAAKTVHDSIKYQIETTQSVTETPSSDSVAITKDETPTEAEMASGTFRANRLLWSKEDKELYFKGKVKVDFEDQHFQGTGTYSFLGEVHLLVVQGFIMELGADVELADANYQITRLDSKKAKAKYGSYGQQGAIEISQAKE